VSQYSILFYEEHDFDDTSIRLVQGAVGLYFIYLPSLMIPYPFAPSCLIYIGMSESRHNSVGNRLRAHKSGQSGNVALTNYAASYRTRFTYHTADVLKALGTDDILELESFFLGDFLRRHGAYPICNNQSGVLFPATGLRHGDVAIDWSFFAPPP